MAEPENADIRAHEPDLLGAAASMAKGLGDPSHGSDNEEEVRNWHFSDELMSPNWIRSRRYIRPSTDVLLRLSLTSSGLDEFRSLEDLL
jgi:hypothetical protein